MVRGQTQADSRLDPAHLPDGFADVAALDEFLSRPSQSLVDDLDRLDGDLLILGVGGKMGPSLARLAKRAAPHKRVVGVARFSEIGLRQNLEAWGVETVACDLLDRAAIERLEKLPNVLFLAGRKFGSVGHEPLTWAMNVHVPALVAETFRHARIVAFSTACVYPFADVLHQGPAETTPPAPPTGEYANSCVGRERMFQYFSETLGTPGCLIRLSYAIDLRYGVLHDIARRIVDGEPVSVSMGHVNVIWQGDANAMALRALLHCQTPSRPLNVTGPEVASVRAIATAMGRRLDRPVRFEGKESSHAWLAQAAEAFRLFGYPVVPLPRMIDWVADWVAQGRISLNKPTHFEVRDGTY